MKRNAPQVRVAETLDDASTAEALSAPWAAAARANGLGRRAWSPAASLVAWHTYGDDVYRCWHICCGVGHARRLARGSSIQSVRIRAAGRSIAQLR